MLYTVYILNNDINDKVYIGCTKNFEDRKKQHVRYLRGGYHSSKKLQLDYNNSAMTISFSILYQSESKEDAFVKEEYYIDEFEAKEKGYNSSDGGLINKGYVQSDYAKEVASVVHSAKIGELNSFYGKTHSKESRLKISKALTGRVGHAHSDEYKLNASINSVCNKPIHFYGEEYRSITEAVNSIGRCKSYIRRRLNDINNNDAYYL